MDRTRSGTGRASALYEESLQGTRTVLQGMIRTGMFVDFLLEELDACRTEAEKEVVCSVLHGAKARMRQLQKRLKRLLASEPFKSPGTGFVVGEKRARAFSMRALQTPA